MAYGEVWQIELLDEWSDKKAHFKGPDKHVVEQKAKAQRMSWDAENDFNQLNNVLEHSLKVNDVIVWESLSYASPFNVEMPKKPSDISISPEPNQLSSKYTPHLSFLDKIFPKLKAEKNRISQELFIKDCEDWLEVKNQNEINKKLAEIKWMESVKNWKIEKEEFENKQRLNNEKIKER